MFPVLCLGSSGSILSALSSRQCLGALLSCTAALSSCLRIAMDALIAAATSLSSSSLHEQAHIQRETVTRMFGNFLTFYSINSKS